MSVTDSITSWIINGCDRVDGGAEVYWIMLCIGLLPVGESLFRNSIQEKAESYCFCAATRISWM
eukprot:scaffold39395_cov63-Cyclotella_meneghiniana.AAC.2